MNIQNCSSLFSEHYYFKRSHQNILNFFLCFLVVLFQISICNKSFANDTSNASNSENVEKTNDSGNARDFDPYSFIRFMGGIGYTGGESVNVGTGTLHLVNFSGGFQVMYQRLSWLSFGAELKTLYAYSAAIIQYSNISRQFNGYRYDLSELKDIGAEMCIFLAPLLTVEFSALDNLLLLKTGLGPYFGIGTNNDIRIGASVGFGVNIPITTWLSIPLMMDFQFILHRPILIPFQFIYGLQFSF